MGLTCAICLYIPDGPRTLAVTVVEATIMRQHLAGF